MRKLPQSFVNDLKHDKGKLHPFLDRIKQDDTLLLSIRDGYINIYYRGGNLIRISYKADGTYKAFFDRRYNKTGALLPMLPDTINDLEDTNAWIAAFSDIKETMDISFSVNNKPEREFQQLIARENNYSTISNETEYFITDIEFSDRDISARFDLLAIRWLASERKKSNKCRAALIELKYGDGALDGSAGLLKHLVDIDTFLSDSKSYETLLNTMEAQFEQLDELNMLKYQHPRNSYAVKMEGNLIPEVIIVLANHNPRSTKLNTILDSQQIKGYSFSSRFDLKFFVASFAGYGFHSDCMLSLSEFQRRLIN